MDEFSLISRFFAPLSKDFPGALNLTDDAALLTAPAGQDMIITKDAIVEGIHFLGSEDAVVIAKKLLRVNLSDLAAKGATPSCYFLAVMLPKVDEVWLARFALGLAEDQQEYGIHLAGGDTVRTTGPSSFSLTAIGHIPSGQMLMRSGAKPGDIIYVSGTLGDSALGLRSLKAGTKESYLQDRYFLPQPRLALGQKLIGLATACMDISDGLVQDLGHLCRASGAGASILREGIPLSPPARAQIEKDESLWQAPLAGGDDYELLFTVPAEKIVELETMALSLGIPVAPIGTITTGDDVAVLDSDGKALTLPKSGFSHF